MQNWVRLTLLSLALSALGAFGTSCTHVNPQVHADDIAMTVRLNRELVRDNARPAPPGRSGSNVSVTVGASHSVSVGHSHRHHGHHGRSVGEDLAVFFLVELPMEIAFSIVVDAIADARSSQVEMWPKGFREEYTQTLRWGKNRVWFPRKLNWKMAPIVVRVTGGWEGEFTINLAVVPDNEKTLR